jgi:tetratricopeptide (TPR) repeat protein
MIRRLCSIILLAGIIFNLQAENVFIETYPSGASVFMNGKLLEDRTPLRLENIKPGTYQIRLVKTDFTIVESTLVVEAGKSALLALPLKSDSVIHRFLGEERIVFNGTPQENKDQIFRLSEGNYSIQRKDGIININPLYEYDWAVKAFLIVVPVFALATAGLAVQDLIENDGDKRLSPTTLAGITLTAGSGGILAGFLINKKRFKSTIPYALADPPASDEVAHDYYNKGEEALTAGNFTDAQRWYLLLMQNQPESRYYPHALYKMAKIHYLGGNDSLAMAELKLLEDKYPGAELYDKICKSIADILYRNREYEKALEYLEKMEFIDPLYSRDEIKRYIETIRELIN